MRTGALWAEFAGLYLQYQTGHHRFWECQEYGVIEKVLGALAFDLKERGKLDLSECCIEGTFAPAKKGPRLGRRSGARVRRSWHWQDRPGLPVAICVESAIPYEVTLVNYTRASSFTEDKPEKLIGNEARDSDPLAKELMDKGLELIAPYRSNRSLPGFGILDEFLFVMNMKSKISSL